MTTTRVVADPITVSVRDASALTGLPRTRIYELLAAGHVDSVREGRRRLVLYRSLRDYVEGLPRDPA